MSRCLSSSSREDAEAAGEPSEGCDGNQTHPHGHFQTKKAGGGESAIACGTDKV